MELVSPRRLSVARVRQLAWLCAALSAFVAADAHAYPWMVRHGYASCAACHVDPSGGTQLTAYGRAQDELLVGWHADPSVLTQEMESGEPAATTGFLWGLVKLPDALNLSSNVRAGGLFRTADEAKPLAVPIVMAADLAATVNIDAFVAHASLGYGLRNVGPAVVFSLTGGPNYALVSREHWLGFKLFDEALTVRAGRVPVPFGLRNIEHTSWVREATRTDINTSQQHGVAVAYNSENLRGELMALLGNYQMRPDSFRERGYAGFLEWAPLGGLALGVSSLMTYAATDVVLYEQLLRHAHGAYVRWSPIPLVAVLAEADLLVGQESLIVSWGGTGWLQVDIEPIQGIHIMPAVEAVAINDGRTPSGVGGWLSAAWYPLPHCELRLDTIARNTFEPGESQSLTGLLQAHFFF